MVDTLRADRLGVYGNQRGLTPFLDELAARGTLFSDAYAACSWTNPSVASVFTSRYPSQHHVTSFDSRLPDAEVTLAESLAPYRYLTLGFTANIRLSRPLGFAQGFRDWAGFLTVAKPRAGQLRRRGLRRMDRVRGTRSARPLFLYFHFMDPHGPYNPPAPYRARFARRADPAIDSAQANQKLVDLRWEALSPAEVDHLQSLYDGEVAYLDSELRRLFDELARRGILEEAVVVVTADHGEEFGEHGLMSHGDSLYNQELRVPLLVLGRGIPAGRVVRDNVSLVDVAPTILALAGVPGSPRFEGRSLVPLLTGSTPPVDVLAELPAESPNFDPRRHTAAIIRGSHKLLTLADTWAAKLGDAEMYNLAADPLESRPVGYVGGPRSLPRDTAEFAGGQLLLGALRQARDRFAERSGGTPEHQPLDPAMQQKLRALGYVN